MQSPTETNGLDSLQINRTIGATGSSVGENDSQFNQTAASMNNDMGRKYLPFSPEQVIILIFPRQKKAQLNIFRN